MYQVKHQIAPAPIIKLFKSQNNHYKMRNPKDFVITSSRTNKKAMCMSETGSRLWNNLNTQIKESKSLNVFKKSLRKHLLSIEQ